MEQKSSTLPLQWLRGKNRCSGLSNSRLYWPFDRICAYVHAASHIIQKDWNRGWFLLRVGFLITPLGVITLKNSSLENYSECHVTTDSANVMYVMRVEQWILLKVNQIKIVLNLFPIYKTYVSKYSKHIYSAGWYKLFLW